MCVCVGVMNKDGASSSPKTALPLSPGTWGFCLLTTEIAGGCNQLRGIASDVIGSGSFGGQDILSLYDIFFFFSQSGVRST